MKSEIVRIDNHRREASNLNLEEDPMADKKYPTTEAEFQEFMLQVVRTLLATLEEKDPILRLGPQFCRRPFVNAVLTYL